MEFKQRSSGLPFKEMGSSPAKQATNVPTHGPVGGVTGPELETEEETENRWNKYTHTPSVAEVLKVRKAKKKKEEEKEGEE